MTRQSMNGDAFLADLPGEDAVVLPAGTPWQVPWELLILGPFTSCVLNTSGEMRHVTAGAMVRAALRISSTPSVSLQPDDYELLPSFEPETPLFDAARSIVETGWNLAVVRTHEPKLVTSRAVFRSLLGHTVCPASSAGSRAQTVRTARGWVASGTVKVN